jgi:hypothetical protein
MRLIGFSISLLFAPAPLGSSPAAEADYFLVQELLVGDEDSRKRAGEELVRAGDKTLLAGMADVLYYYYVVGDRKAGEELSRLMLKVSGEKSIGRNLRRGWAEWIGRHEEIQPKAGYLAFKASVFARYDPAFRRFLDPKFKYRIRPEEIEWGGVRKDGIPALLYPRHIPAARADYLKGKDRVFGVFLNGEARAYPHRILDWHEMCNDLVGGAPVSLSYCTLCGAGILYDGRVGEETYTFGSSGMLYRSNKLMYDRQTESLWNQLTGEPVSGQLADSGIRLRVLPLVVTTWEEWLKRHPDTLVLDIDTGFNRDYSRGPYEDYFKSKDTMFPVWLTRDDLPAKEVVFALVVNGRPKAYSLETLKKEGITHDRLGGKDLVLVTNKDSGAVRAYASSGKRFKAGSTDTQLIEEGSGVVWKLGEEALQAEGQRLERQPGHMAFWFGWFAFYPTTEVYR